jgi:hypothetical protein
MEGEMADKEILVKDGVVIKAPENSVIRPGNIRVEADKYETYLSPVISGLAVLFLQPAVVKKINTGYPESNLTS